MQLSCDAILRPCARLLPVFLSCGAVFYSLIAGLPSLAADGLNVSDEGERPLAPRKKRFNDPPQASEADAPGPRPGRWRGNEDFAGEGEGRSAPGMERGPGFERPARVRQGGVGRMPGMAPLDLSLLNLSEEQKNKIRAMRESSAAKGRELVHGLKQSRVQMRDMMFDPEVSEATLRSRHAQLKKQEEELGSLMINDFLAIRGVLTPEQLKHLPELKPQGRGAAPSRGGSRSAAP